MLWRGEQARPAAYLGAFVLLAVLGCSSEPTGTDAAPAVDASVAGSGDADTAGWSEPTTVSLSWAAPTYPSSTYTLDEAQLQGLCSAEAADAAVLLELDLGTPIQSALSALREACGPGWQTGDVSSSCPVGWSQEQTNLYRLVTMTPANTNVAGTSVSGLEEIASQLSDLGLIESHHEILAAMLGLGATDPILSAASLAQALEGGVIATHPSVTPGGLLPITLADAFTDVSTLSSRFDAAGAHPGFLDSAAASTSAEILSDAFLVTLVATSNLHWHEGLDLGSGPASLAIIADLSGPTYGDVLEYDFVDADAFNVEGLGVSPTIDVVLKMLEDDTWISGGSSVTPMPRGNGAVWSLDPWKLELAFADAAFRDYEPHRAGCDLCAGASAGALLYETPVLGIDECEIVVGRAGYDDDEPVGGQDGAAEHFPYIDPNPAGWLRIWTLFGLGDPPAPQYVWDMILELVERRLLDGGAAQGAGDVRLALSDVPVGPTEGQVEAAIRPILEGQTAELSALFVPDYHEPASGLDLFLAKPDDGNLYLYFVHASDAVPEGTATHANPGFFADAELTDKVSTAESGATGDSLHEKLALAEEQTVYCEDEAGAVYRLEVAAPQNDSVGVVIRRRLQD